MHACMAEATPKMLRFRTTLDGKEIEIEKAAAAMSGTIGRCLDQDSAVDEAIPIDNISSTFFAKVAEYCKRGGGEKELDDWDGAFLQDLDGRELYLLVLAANYLEVDCFRDRIVDKVAEMIKGKMPEEIRAWPGIVNDLTLEEEMGINDKYPWALAKKED